VALETIRVLHITEAFAGGVLTYLRNMLPELVKLHCDVTLVCSLGRGWPGAEAVLFELRQAGVVTQTLPMCREIRPLQDAVSFVGLWSVLREGCFDVAHSHASKAGALARIAARCLAVPAVFHTPHCFAFERARGFAQRALYVSCERVLGRFTDSLVAVSAEEARLAEKTCGLSADRCVALRNGLSQAADGGITHPPATKEQRKAALGVCPSAPTVATACRLTQDKGLTDLIEAAALSLTPGAQFLIAGEGPLRKALERCIARSGLQERVRLLGHVETVDDLYAAADLVVFCSRTEGMPYAIIEAMRAGRPVIAYDTTSSRELVDSGRTGRLVPFGPRRLAEAIDEVLLDASKRDAWGQNAKLRFLERHLVRDKAASLVALYRRALERAPRHKKVAEGAAEVSCMPADVFGPAERRSAGRLIRRD
jgi:glycosyltransferase involved in cell wall biosynthesis